MFVAPRRPARVRRGRRDRGLVMPLVAMMSVVLLAFVGFAVDLGYIFGVRRQAQSAADTAAMAVAGEFLQAGGTPGQGAAYGKALSYQTVGKSVGSPTAWNAEFVDCVDPAAYPTDGLPNSALTAGQLDGSAWPADGSHATDKSHSCISYSLNGQRVRVRIPDFVIPTSFAKLVGVDHLSTTAAAEAQLSFNFPGGILPYGVPTISADSTVLCLGTASALPGYLNMCEGNQQGNFGALDPSFYGNYQLGTATVCSKTSNAEDRIAMATTIGIDHPISAVPADSGDPNQPTTNASLIRNDRTVCVDAQPYPPPFNTRPNEFPTQTGLSATQKGVREGLYQGVEPSVATDFGLTTAPSGRLTHLTSGDAGVEVNSKYPNLDNVPLWHYLTPGLQGSDTPASNRVPQSCVKEYDSSNWNVGRMGDCLQQWTDWATAGYQPSILFGADTDGDPNNGMVDIMRSGRFGFVPLLWTNFPSGSSDPVQIKDFRAIFIQTTFWGCNGAKCDAVFNPGESLQGNPKKTDELDATTALAIQPGMLPVEARDVAPGGSNELGIQLVR